MPGGNDECWPWRRAKTAAGYGMFARDGKRHYAHRYSYEVYVGPIPAGAHILHRCDNPPCVNPAHLFLGDQRSNNADMLAKGRGHDIGPRPGSTNGMAKLTEEDVKDIRSLYDGQRGSQSELARWYGIAPQTLRDAVVGRTWRHVPSAPKVQDLALSGPACRWCCKPFKYYPWLRRHEDKCLRRPTP